MKAKSRFTKLLTTALAVCLTVPGGLLQAAEADSGIQDVRLHRGSVLVTRVVDLQGQPVAGESVGVLYQGRQIASAVSDAEGFVVVRGMRPGLHTIETRVTATACRLWEETTAPPSAVTVPAVVSDLEIVRGQFGGINLPMIVYAGGTIAALAVAIQANNDADDANAALAALQKKVDALASP